MKNKWKYVPSSRGIRVSSEESLTDDPPPLNKRIYKQFQIGDNEPHKRRKRFRLKNLEVICYVMTVLEETISEMTKDMIMDFVSAIQGTRMTGQVLFDPDSRNWQNIVVGEGSPSSSKSSFNEKVLKKFKNGKYGLTSSGKEIGQLIRSKVGDDKALEAMRNILGIDLRENFSLKISDLRSLIREMLGENGNKI